MSIDKISISNFQSHQDTTLELHPGINAVIGPSDSGKTSILRSLYWAIYNRPSGDAFVSYWARNEKGKQVETTQIIIEKGNQYVARYRSADLNGYKLQDQNLEAIRTDVPATVKDFFNIEDVNLQKQMDAPFLLSGSAGEIARFFNRIIKLDVIDSALSLADKKKRDTVKDLKTEKEKIEQLEKELKEYTWIDKAEPIIKKAEELLAEQKKDETGIESLGASVLEYNGLKDKLPALNEIISLETSLIRAEKLAEKIEKARAELEPLEKSAESYDIYKKQLEKLPDIEKAGEIYSEAEKIGAEIRESTENGIILKGSQDEYERAEKTIKHRSELVQELTESLPDVCPTCGAPMRKDNV